MSKYSTAYFRLATQRKVPDEILRNIRSVHINGYTGTGKVNYLAKDPRTKKWQLFWLEFKLSRPTGVPDYSLNYMRGLTQGKIKDNILGTIDSLAIVKHTVTFTYKENGIARNGRVRLEGM